MASKTSSRKTNTAAKTSNRKKTTAAKRKGKKQTSAKTAKNQNTFLKDEVIILVTLGISIILLLSNFGIGGFLGEGVSSILFGIFGFIAYIIPIVLFIGVTFFISNKGNSVAYAKTVSGIVLICMLCTLLQLLLDGYHKGTSLFDYYRIASRYKTDGGILGGIFVKMFCPSIGVVPTYIIVVFATIICMIIITEKSFLTGIKKGGAKAYQSAKEDVKRRKENKERRLAEQEARNAEAKEEKNRYREQEDIDPSSRMTRTVSGVSFDTTLKKRVPGVKELHPEEMEPSFSQEELFGEFNSNDPSEPERPLVINRVIPAQDDVKEEWIAQDRNNDLSEIEEETSQVLPESVTETHARPRKTKESAREVALETAGVEAAIAKDNQKPKAVYHTPPLSLLKRGKKSGGDSDTHLRETALKLEQTLQSFGVGVTVTNVSCGPCVTRYELQPEQGVKVSKIVGLADDIKLNLAAADIRIEAPIPGKAAVGIEVPNKENSAVMLRDLIETDEFQRHESNIAFAAGRDISGKVVVTDIQKMPHLLIAGATGSGKSVCINTLIISILFKAKPDDVKLIMIDPKVVELSVYNGIPHLMIPVVTDPKKAAGALNWAVAEMTKRYQLFAEYNVRDLKGYNDKIESIKDIEEERKPVKLPQIVIIVDELADLMMVAPGEVEEAICRLAQLARAAGLHLVLATQRPSVNVITGLIKANMPSRIAFSVTSNVDSRTIIDMVGAEKLLGKGDMLFYPSGYQKPVRVQGAFVSDREVQSVVEYLVHRNGEVNYDNEIAEHINSTASGAGNIGGEGGAFDEKDVYFVDAGKFIIEKDKASIGMLQRVFKIGFNRAARIMDQLCEAGVVGEEEGTKPRKILMSMEEFERYVEEYV